MLELAALLLFADVNHVVARGHTIEAIAHRYHVSVKAIVEANHLKDPRHLKPGQVLVIPGVDPQGKHGAHSEAADKRETPDKREASEKRDHAHGAHTGGGDHPDRPDHERAEHAEHPDHADHGEHAEHAARADRPEHRSPTASLAPPPEPHGRSIASGPAAPDGTIHAIRLGEEFRIRVKDSHGRIPSSAVSAFERMMRQGNATHPIDPRLVALVGIVSAHFGGKPLEVVSGFRAYTPTQYTPHSNHNLGRALDFHIGGVRNEDLWAFCRTLRAAGCGYYPNSTFVHLDVRETKTFWIDRSRPGEPPQYDSPDAAADETASDVPGASEEAQSPSAPTSPAAPASAVAPAAPASPASPASAPQSVTAGGHAAPPAVGAPRLHGN